MFYKHTKKVSFWLTWQRHRSILYLVRLSSTVNANMIMLTVIALYMLTSYWKTKEKTWRRSVFFPFISTVCPPLIFFFFFFEKEQTSCHLLPRFKKTFPYTHSSRFEGWLQTRPGLSERESLQWSLTPYCLRLDELCLPNSKSPWTSKV